MRRDIYRYTVAMLTIIYYALRWADRQKAGRAGPMATKS